MQYPSIKLPEIEFIAIDEISQLTGALTHRHKYFTLLLAWDAPESRPQGSLALFRPLVEQGLAYFCAWGINCEQLHDAVDMCVVEKEIEIGESDYILMTTWHSGESFQEALEFFTDLAVPAESHVFSDLDRFVVTVGNPESQRL